MITNKVSTEIAGMEPGKVFFPSDLAKVGTKTSHVLKVLERATKAGIILRLAQGIYYYPKTDDKDGDESQHHHCHHRLLEEGFHAEPRHPAELRHLARHQEIHHQLAL